MSGRKGIQQISEIANGVLDPVLAKRAGINTMLLGMWDEIAGPDFAECTRPEKIKWPRRDAQNDSFVPGTLTIACEGARALFLVHSQDQLIQRLNSVFGFPAVERIKIVQKPVSSSSGRHKRPRALSPDRQEKLDDMITGIESENLRQALRRLGTGVMGRPSKGR
ncbi:DUF721 domain-containing protein [Hoeflea prorocentri]|uniref:DUF721 domain-containing protein n=1 Tax=Hoeflea prorocentri TaxID=1922333 RepID=A0A9X3UIW8_9HYPH|nr:DUF721 domain-containing protein [Hoeflea prorocentri]MCY6381640.1 DUF721 domain-containing protein [Hoeflea prorocentri]MDA5399440.1 DUF721 domain-containing protein [Hoeflea prorocentri]